MGQLRLKLLVIVLVGLSPVKGTFKNVEMYAAAVAYHCEKMSRL